MKRLVMFLLCGNYFQINGTQSLEHMLSRAITLHDHDKTERLINSGVDVENDSHPLMQAVMQNNEVITLLLLKAGADPDMVDDDGRTVLMIAALQGNVKIAASLLKFEADATIADDDGRSAIVFAAQKGHDVTVSLLLKALGDQEVESKTKALLAAARFGYQKCVELLVVAGADVNGEDDNGYYALMWASQRGDYGMVETLLQSGAHVDVVSCYKIDLIVCSVFKYILLRRIFFGNLNALYKLSHKQCK